MTNVHFLQRPVGALKEDNTSPPSRLLSLTHWEIILSRLTPEDREWYRTYFCPMDLDGCPMEIASVSYSQPQAPVAALLAPTPIPFIDTHTVISRV